VSVDPSPDDDFELKLIFLRELGSGHARAQKAHEKLRENPDDAQAAQELRDFFRRVADTAEAVDLALLARLGAACQRAAEALIEGDSPEKAVLALGEGLAGAAAVLEGRARSGEDPGRPRGDAPPSANLLVIDSDPVNTRLASEMLSAAGFAFASCEPDRALDSIALQMPDLIVMDSLELCRKLRAHPLLRMTPILVAARADAQLRARALRSGASDLVARPFEARDLLTSVRWHLQRLLEVREMPIRDGLTRTYNREYFDLRLDQEMGRARRYQEGFCVCLVEIDGFDRIAQGYGPAAADAVLAHLASVLTASVRMTDVVARRAGEQFALTLIEAGAAEAVIVADRIRESIGRRRFGLPPLRGQNIDVNCTVSIGIAPFLETDSLYSLLQRAGTSLQEAKAAGDNQVRVAQ